MTNLKRIRLDPDGLITQDQKGRMRRVFLSKDEVSTFERNPETGLRNLSKKYDELKYFFDGNTLDAKVDIINEEEDCLNRPLRIYYGIEPRCNLACKFCGPRDLHNTFTSASEDKEDFILQQIADANTFQIQLTGGEIFVRGYDLLKVVEKTKSLGLATILATNGVWGCIDGKDTFLEKLAQYNHIIEVKVSIEGKPEFHDTVRKTLKGRGTYEEAVDTLAKLSSYGMPVRINTTIFRESCNLEQLEHLVDLAEKYNAGLQTIPLRPTGRAYHLFKDIPTKEQLAEYTKHATRLRKEKGIPISFNFDIFDEDRQIPIYDPHRPISCSAPLWGCPVTHTGEVYPCGFSIEIDNKRFLAGVISEETSLLDIWLHSEVLREVRDAGKPDECNSCKYYGKGCWGGCWVDAYITTGKLNGLDPHCLKEYKK